MKRVIVTLTAVCSLFGATAAFAPAASAGVGDCTDGWVNGMVFENPDRITSLPWHFGYVNCVSGDAVACGNPSATIDGVTRWAACMINS